MGVQPTKWIPRGSLGTITTRLSAGEYKFLINKDGAEVQSIEFKVALETESSGNGGGNNTLGIRGSYSNNNTPKIPVNEEVYLVPSHNTVYGTIAQKYGIYSFVVAENSQVTISFTPPNDSGSWLSLNNEDGTQITTKWTAQNTTGTLGPVALQAGTYRFFINTSGRTEKSIKFKVSLVSDPNTGGNNTALTREGLIQLIKNWVENPNEVNANAVVNADTSAITDMSELFSFYRIFRNTSPVGGNIPEMNLNLSNWDTSSVTNMYAMFLLSGFNQDIGAWNVSNVTDMGSMFAGSSFNQPIGNWDVSNVTNMEDMFAGSSFNQPIGNWDVSNVTNMYGMFRAIRFGNGGCQAGSFNQNISNWNVTNVSSSDGFSTGCEYPAYEGPLDQQNRPQF